MPLLYFARVARAHLSARPLVGVSPTSRSNLTVWNAHSPAFCATAEVNLTLQLSATTPLSYPAPNYNHGWRRCSCCLGPWRQHRRIPWRPHCLCCDGELTCRTVCPPLQFDCAERLRQCEGLLVSSGCTVVKLDVCQGGESET